MTFKFAPKSLYTRFLLITLIPIIVVQFVTTYIFYENHWDNMTRNMATSLTGEISLVVNGITNVDEAQQSSIFEAAKQYMSLQITLEKNAKISEVISADDRFNQFKFYLGQKITQPYVLTPYDKGNTQLEIQLDSDVLKVVFSNKRLASPTSYIFIMWVFGSAFVLTAMSILFLRGQVRSILELSEVAEKFGKGQDFEDFKPRGAKEIRLAGVAFIEMRERIKRLIGTRTQMLAGVSHDLRTPLTRMKLELSMMEQNQKVKDLEEEVEEMHKMLEGYLSFAQLESNEEVLEPTENTNLRQMVQKLIDKYKNFEGEFLNDVDKNFYINVKPTYFQRALVNLLDNATRYAKNIQVRAKILEDGSLEILIDDDGVGIDETKLEEVFQPFYRIDESRNMQTGGVGLGLTIVRDIIHKHGGEVKLTKSHLGGLRVEIHLPN
jgi:two-component system osmolarity sensor histidine kinase EnvZ